MNGAVTVSQLNRYVKARIEEDPRLRELLLEGEISNLNQHYRSGHIYFVLKDAKAAVKAVMFRSNAQRLRFPLSDGMKVVARCSASLYERDGSYQIYVSELFSDGAGALYEQLEQLKKKLAAEGLFDPAHKRPLPAYPAVIGIVTSPTGAALQDMLNILGRRWPLARVILSPALVQGADAPRSLAAALRRLVGTRKCDVIIMGRGGGSIEDLWAFNDETLARLVYACPVPVVSAVGHETDYSLCDFTADVRAPTPSAAAELVSPDARDLYYRLGALENSLESSVHTKIARAEERVRAAAKRAEAYSPRGRLQERERRLEGLKTRIASEIRRSVLQKETRARSAARVIESLSPLRVLERGYGLISREGKPVRSVSELQPGQVVRGRLADGTFRAEITDVAPGGARTGRLEKVGGR